MSSGEATTPINGIMVVMPITSMQDIINIAKKRKYNFFFSEGDKSINIFFTKSFKAKFLLS